MAHVDALSRAVPTTAAEEDPSVSEKLYAHLDVFVALTATEKVRFMQQGDPPTKDLIGLVLVTTLRELLPTTKNAS